MPDTFWLANLDSLLWLFFILWAATTAIFAVYRRRNPRIDLADAPILLGYYSVGKHMIQAAKGKINGMKYSAIVILGTKDGSNLKDQALLYRVELPFKTKLHLLGIPRGSGAAQLNPARDNHSLMEKVYLEGNYNNYFTLFCEKGMQVQTRYAMDPMAMLFTIDFCRSHSWEIVGDELYFVQPATARSKHDPTFMYDDIQEFIDQIRPAIAEPSNHKPNPYADDDNSQAAPASESEATEVKLSDYSCPVCQISLYDHNDHYSCPQRHGLLVVGYKLPHVKQGELPNPPSAARRTHHNPLNCPVCGHAMEHVPYAGSQTVIDSCTNCPYRWLDAGELAPQSKLAKS